MDPAFDTLYSTLMGAYKKETDQDFPTNKIRFFMDFLWNAILQRPLTETQKGDLKSLIDLLNSFDDHKLSAPREIITNLNSSLQPLLVTYPSLGHTFTFVITTLTPSYQKYLTSLEGMVKDAHAFTKEEVLLYYDMTLIDHAILSHVFESESSLNLIEVITSIKTVITVNALTHDYLQDALNRSISLFTFLQRGGLAKEKCHDFYLQLVDDILAAMSSAVTNEKQVAAVRYLCTKLVELSTQKAMEATSATNETAALDALLQEAAPASAPVPPASPAQPLPVSPAAPPVVPVSVMPEPPVTQPVIPETPVLVTPPPQDIAVPPSDSTS